MNTAELWNTKEKTLIDTITERLNLAGLTDMQSQLSESIAALGYQAIALSLYPSILKSNRFGGCERNLETLVSALSERYREEDVFVLPTKAILSRSFEIGKINLFYMLNHACALLGREGHGIDLDPLECVIAKILSIMTENVLLDLLSDSTRKEVKSIAAAALAEMWEGRVTAESISFNPELRNMWLVRKDSAPVFGTLLGVHEYFILFKKANDVCRRYVHYSTSIPDEAYALEEFLFGLTHEELQVVKAALDRSGKAFFSRDEIADIVGDQALFFINPASDPLELYRFYNHRRRNAFARRQTGARGPIRTFEENFMAYLLLGKDTTPAHKVYSTEVG